MLNQGVIPSLFQNLPMKQIFAQSSLANPPWHHLVGRAQCMLIVYTLEHIAKVNATLLHFFHG